MIEQVVDSVHSLLMDHLPVRATRTPSGWITLNCPMCSDKRKRGGINSQGAKISYHCFNCGYTTGWSPGPKLGKRYCDLAERLGAPLKEINDIKLALLKHTEGLEGMEAGAYVFTAQKFEPVSLPDNTELVENLPDDHEVKQYAKQRGIYGLYPLLYFDDLAHRKRLIIPFMYNNEVIGWSGRHINPPDKSTAKYLTNLPAGGGKYVFNIDRFADSDRKYVIVVEGLMDAILIDGVAIMSNKVTPEQAHLLDKLGKTIILCPDRDKPGKVLIEQAAALGWMVSFPNWAPDIKDAADACKRYGRLATVQSIINSATDNQVKIKVKTKML